MAAELVGMPDVPRQERAVVAARTRRELYSGPFANESPDVVVECNAGYRVSWSSVLGGFGDAVIEDNRRPWGGDHIVAPALVPGVLFSSLPLDDQSIAMVDLAPTILSALGVPIPGVMEGSNRLR